MIEKINTTQLIIGTVASLLLSTVAMLETLTPLEFAHGFLYLPIVLVVAITQCRAGVRAVTLVSAILTIFGVWWSAPGWDNEVRWQLIYSHRLLAVLVLLVVHSLIENYISLLFRLENARDDSELQRLSDNLPILIRNANGNGRGDYFARPATDYIDIEPKKNLKHWQIKSLNEWLNSVSTKIQFRTEFRIPVHHRRFDWSVAQAAPVFNKHGNVVKWYESAINITNLKMLQRQHLKQAEHHYNVLEKISDGFFSLNTFFNFTYINHQAGKMLGASVEYLLGKSVWSSGTGLSEEVIETMQSSYRMQESISFTQMLEHNQTWLEVRIYPSSEGLLVFLRDVTQERELQQQLNHAQRIESLGHLTGAVAHDFNNLLTVIVGNTDLLLRHFDQQAPDNERLSKIATLIMSTAEKGVSLTDKLLAFSRRQKLTPEIVEVNLLLKELEYLLATTLGDEHRCELKLHSQALQVCIDAGQLEHVLLNLVINARDAMLAPGEVTISVHPFAIFQNSTLERESLMAGHYALIEVMDTGTGIADNIKHRIFEPFFSTKDRGKGTGLGLSSAYAFIKQSGGYMNVSSRQGEGSVFRLYIPLSKVSSSH